MFYNPYPHHRIIIINKKQTNKQKHLILLNFLKFMPVWGIFESPITKRTSSMEMHGVKRGLIYTLKKSLMRRNILLQTSMSIRPLFLGTVFLARISWHWCKEIHHSHEWKSLGPWWNCKTWETVMASISAFFEAGPFQRHVCDQKKWKIALLNGYSSWYKHAINKFLIGNSASCSSQDIQVFEI